MYFADEIRDPMTEVPAVPSEVDFSGRELTTAKLLIDSMASAWDPSLYEDEYRKRVEGLIDEKRQGKVIVTERPETQPTKVVDLMEALQASVEAARSHRPGAHITTPAGSAQAPAKRSAKRAGTSSTATGSSGLEQDRAPGPGHRARHPGPVEDDSRGARGGGETAPPSPPSAARRRSRSITRHEPGTCAQGQAGGVPMRNPS